MGVFTRTVASMALQIEEDPRLSMAILCSQSSSGQGPFMSSR